VITTFFEKNSGKCANFEVSSLGLELQVSSLGLRVFDEVSVSSRNFNQVSVSVLKVTVSTTSLQTKQTISMNLRNSYQYSNLQSQTETKVAKRFNRKSSIPIQTCLRKNDNIQIHQYVEMSQDLNPTPSTC